MIFAPESIAFEALDTRASSAISNSFKPRFILYSIEIDSTLKLGFVS